MTVESAPTASHRGSLLLVSVYFPPAGGGGVLRVTKLVKYLTRLGWSVRVICSDERPVVADETLLGEISPSVHVLRVRGPFRFVGGRATGIAATSQRRGFVARLIAAGMVAIRSVLIPDRWIGWAWMVRRLPLTDLGTPDLVLSSGPPHSAHLAASALSRRIGVPHVVDLRDDWGANPVHETAAPWYLPLQRRLEQGTLRRAARAVTIYETSSRAIRLRYPTLPTPITSIPNGFDAEDFAGLPDRKPRAATEPVRFLYAGSLRGMQDVGRFFEVFGRIARSDALVHLELLGPISPRHQALARAAIPATALAIRPPASHRTALEAMSSSDVLVVFTGGGGAGADTMTGKVFEYLAVRRPILLVGPRGPAADLVAASGAGVLCEPGDTSGIEEAIGQVIERAGEPGFAGAADAFLESFSRAHLARTYDALLDAVRRGEST